MTVPLPLKNSDDFVKNSKQEHAQQSETRGTQNDLPKRNKVCRSTCQKKKKKQVYCTASLHKTFTTTKKKVKLLLYFLYTV